MQLTKLSVVVGLTEVPSVAVRHIFMQGMIIRRFVLAEVTERSSTVGHAGCLSLAGVVTNPV